MHARDKTKLYSYFALGFLLCSFFLVLGGGLHSFDVLSDRVHLRFRERMVLNHDSVCPAGLMLHFIKFRQVPVSCMTTEQRYARQYARWPSRNMRDGRVGTQACLHDVHNCITRDASRTSSGNCRARLAQNAPSAVLRSGRLSFETMYRPCASTYTVSVNQGAHSQVQPLKHIASAA